MNFRHPTFERLADLAENRLTRQDREALQLHLADCERCSADVDWLKTTIGNMGSDATEAPPEHVLNRAVRLFRQHRFSDAPVSRLRRFVGALRFDSATTAPAFGLRAAPDQAIRQMLFDALPFELELRARAAIGGTWAVAGQLLGPAESIESGRVQLIGSDSHVEAELSDMLEFSLPAVPSGTYRLEVHLADATEIDVPRLELGP